MLFRSMEKKIHATKEINEEMIVLLLFVAVSAESAKCIVLLLLRERERERESTCGMDERVWESKQLRLGVFFIRVAGELRKFSDTNFWLFFDICYIGKLKRY